MRNEKKKIKRVRCIIRLNQSFQIRMQWETFYIISDKMAYIKADSIIFFKSRSTIKRLPKVDFQALMMPETFYSDLTCCGGVRLSR